MCLSIMVSTRTCISEIARKQMSGKSEADIVTTPVRVIQKKYPSFVLGQIFRNRFVLKKIQVDI